MVSFTLDTVKSILIYRYLLIYQTPVHGYVMRVLNLAYHNYTVQTAYAINISKSIEHKILIVLHIMGINFNKKVVVASSIIALCYLINSLHNVFRLQNFCSVESNKMRSSISWSESPCHLIRDFISDDVHDRLCWFRTSIKLYIRNNRDMITMLPCRGCFFVFRLL